MRILEKHILAQAADTRIVQFVVDAPLISRKAKAGQFIVLMVSAEGERIPLTIVDANQERGTITIIVQEMGLTTRLLSALNKGDSLYALVGPLGHATEIKNYGTVLIVGGGVGIAEIYPVAKAFKKAGNRVLSVLGTRTKDLLILEKELQAVSDALYVTTDDGSYGKKGFVSDMMKELLVADQKNPQIKLAYCVGPIPMMRAVAKLTEGFHIKTIVSLNALMVDATGMCGCCRVSVAGKTQFSCVDGPEFDGHQVDWVELIKRNQIYSEQEKHICKLLVK